MKDPVVEEIHKIRRDHAQEFGYNLVAISADLKKIQKECGHKVLGVKPEKPTGRDRKLKTA